MEVWADLNAHFDDPPTARLCTAFMEALISIRGAASGWQTPTSFAISPSGDQECGASETVAGGAVRGGTVADRKVSGEGRVRRDGAPEVRGG
jgi:hypothetical protein